MKFKEYMDVDTNNWPLLLRELAIKKYGGWNILYTVERMNELMGYVLLSSAFDIEKYDELVKKYENILLSDNWGNRNTGSNSNNSVNENIQIEGYTGQDLLNDFKRDSQNGTGETSGNYVNQNVDQLNSFLMLNEMEISGLYKKTLNEIRKYLQTIYIVNEGSV